MSDAPRILVASDAVDDAEVVTKLLREEFDQVTSSTVPDRAVADFETTRPHVLVFAFDGLSKAERYYLGLYRLSRLASELPHRTVILCGKDDLRRAYELCKKEYFDDYVLFWPLNHDALRLPMAVHQALRQIRATGASRPGAAEFALHARGLAPLESQLEQYAARGQARLEAASASLERAEQDIGLALDGLSLELFDGELRGLVDAKDRPRFQRAVDRLKVDHIAKQLDAVGAAMHPVRQWANEVRQEFSAQVESSRVLRNLAEQVRPLVLVVDDDELQHKLLRHLLREEPLELAFASSGIEALVSVCKREPQLILMDMDLPDLDGVEATRRIKSIGRLAQLPVLMVTGHSGKDVVMQSVSAGAADFLVKPFSEATLRARVRRYLTAPAGSLELESAKR
jgi:CheY-like chemotaxis protein